VCEVKRQLKLSHSNFHACADLYVSIPTVLYLTAVKMRKSYSRKQSVQAWFNKLKNETIVHNFTNASLRRREKCEEEIFSEKKKKKKTKKVYMAQLFVSTCVCCASRCCLCCVC
jgi:TRAP-type mannitol/chloroaromatic compound transport system substrate-binding protein